MKKIEKKRVLFVCLGNICRSPTAHGVFQDLLNITGLGAQVVVDSAGTAAFHIGKAPDSRSVAAAKQRGYDLSGLRARQVSAADFNRFDYILAMDSSNLANLEALCPDDYRGHLGLFLDFTALEGHEVPDPYYGGQNGFDHVLDLVESASEGLLCRLRKEIRS
ncbi:MAG: low molecular weight protein-tyrosine-phosphatase [Pontibacterium sp.]